MRVSSGFYVVIAGFIITGTEPKKCRAARNRAVPWRFRCPRRPTRYVSPVVWRQPRVAVENDNWREDPSSAAQLTALGLGLQDPNESGIVAPLQPGTYTTILTGRTVERESVWLKSTMPTRQPIHNWLTSARAALF